MQTLFNAPAGGQGADVVKDTDTASFVADVIEGSREQPVIVDFWATWCGPCVQLGPALEKAVRATKGAVKLVKLDIDKHPHWAQQMRVQSIPAVYAFYQGRPVDGFVGNVPESQIKQFVEKLATLAGGAQDNGVEEALAHAAQVLEAGDVETAGAIYTQVLQFDPNSAAARAGLARCLIASGQADQARALIDGAPEEIARDKDIVAVRTALDLADQAADAGPIPELTETVTRNPDDHQARYDLAMALYAAGKREAAVDELLEIVKRDREWNEQQARKQLVKFFEAFGPTDKLTIMARRRLSSILFA